MTLSGTATVYYVVTAINGSTESLSNAIPVAATTPYLPQALLWWQMFLFDVHLQVYPIGMNHHRMLDR
jgi:hypothetical protein